MKAALLCLLLLATSFASVADEQQTPCTMCELVVTYVQAYLNNNQTEAQIVKELEQFCQMVGSAQCKAMVDQYIPQIIEYIEKDYTPQEVCTQLGLCISAKKVESGPLCSVCTLVITYIDQYISSNSSIQQIEAELDQICALLGPLSSTCDQFVAQYTPQAIKWIVNGNSPATFCASVGLCSSKINDFEPVLVKRNTQQGGCSVCELVVQYVESYIASNQTEQQIIKKLEGVCSLLGPLSGPCTSFVDTYLPQLIQWIENGESPQAFCTQIGLCSSARLTVKKVKATSQKLRGGVCSICQTLVALIENYVAAATTEDKIEAELAKVCQALGPYAQECDNLIDEYLPQLVQWVVAKENPATLCAQIKVC
jgi:saposin